MAAALPVIGGAIGAVGAIQAGRAASNADSYNAAVNERNAAIALGQGDAQARQAGILSSQRIGAARADYGASGVTTEGSPLDVLEMSASQAALEQQNIKYNATLRAIGYSDTAAADRRRATTDRTQSYYSAASSLLMGGGRSYGSGGAGTPIDVGAGPG